MKHHGCFVTASAARTTTGQDPSKQFSVRSQPSERKALRLMSKTTTGIDFTAVPLRTAEDEPVGLARCHQCGATVLIGPGDHDARQDHLDWHRNLEDIFRSAFDGIGP